MRLEPTWLTAFVDLPRSEFRDGARLLTRLTGYELSKGRGRDREFASLVPSAGDPFVRVQRLGAGPARVHLDVEVDEVDAAVTVAQQLGAVLRHSVSGPRGTTAYVVLDSPGGLPFCLVDGIERVRPAPGVWPGGHRSLLDQVSIDSPREAYDEECEFWARFTGWRLRTSRVHPEFAHLMRPDAIPLRVLLQRLDEPAGPVRAHLDWATDDRLRETERHRLAGAEVGAHHDAWTVMYGPPGLAYCLTDRHPGSPR